MCGTRAKGRPNWPRCGSQDCTGIQLPGQELCLAHAEETARAAFLAGLQPRSHLDLRGTPISSDLLAAVVEALEEDGKPRLGTVWFHHAQFSGDAGFMGAQFSGDARFDGAQFSGDAWFDGTQFSDTANFRGTQFNRE